jgi:hypothetical protein
VPCSYFAKTNEIALLAGLLAEDLGLEPVGEANGRSGLALGLAISLLVQRVASTAASCMVLRWLFCSRGFVWNRVGILALHGRGAHITNVAGACASRLLA